VKLDRNINANGRGKYALLKLRGLDNIDPKLDLDVEGAIDTLEAAGILDWGNTIDSEFMVIRLKDINAQPALRAYAGHARQFDPEYSNEIMEMADRSGVSHLNCKQPD
jgi:hypothetical protein